MTSRATASDLSENTEENATSGGSRAARSSDSSVEYDGPALVELSLDEVDYRIDVGKAGTAICISTRPSGSYEWTFGGEARWENRRLRARGIDREVLDVLAKALAEVSENE
jgi:hypothetical protein